MKCCRTLAFCLLWTATTRGQSDTQPVPGLGDRTSDGFLVKCYWIGAFKIIEKEEDQGVTDLFGQAFSPVCGKSVTTASIIITEEADPGGQRRAVVRAGSWESKFTGLHYWFKNGKRVGAGPGGSGAGRIPTSGEGAPAVSITTAQNSAGISLSWTESDALAFDVKYRPLELVMGGPSPLGIGPAGRQHLEIGTTEKTKRRKVHVMGMTALDEPIQPRRNTVIRQEWGDPGSNFYACWVMTRVCEYAALKLVTPRGNPRTAPRDSGAGQNEFTFDASNPGRMVINFKAKLVPSIPGLATKMAPRVRFRIDEIANTLPQWDRPNPDGQSSVEGEFLVAKLTVIGLPKRNSDFGRKRVELLLDGGIVESTDVEVFFSKKAQNHPGTIGVPNWFHYWQDGGVCGIEPGMSYDSRAAYGWTAFPSHAIYLGPAASEVNDGPIRYTSRTGYGSVTTTGRGKGIKCVAETVEHEKHHVLLDKTFAPTISATPSLDPDTDGIPSASEAGLDGVRSDPADPDTFRVGGHDTTYGDDEVRCRIQELQLSIPYFPDRDWANPGCQSRNRFGPD